MHLYSPEVRITFLDNWGCCVVSPRRDFFNLSGDKKVDLVRVTPFIMTAAVNTLLFVQQGT